MKTNQILQRKMGNFDVLQRTSDGMFNATALLKQWNLFGKGSQKEMGDYFALKQTDEFLSALISEDDFKDGNSPYLKSRGKYNGGTWMHPLLFIDFAMWLNPTFKVKVLRFVYDQLIQIRNDAGDAYKEMAESVASIIPKEENVMKSIKYVAHAINIVVWGKHERDIRNKQAEEGKMRDLLELEKDVAKLIKKKFIRNINQLREYLLQEYRDRHEPKLLTA